jgi:hypothetical protein
MILVSLVFASLWVFRVNRQTLKGHGQNSVLVLHLHLEAVLLAVPPTPPLVLLLEALVFLRLFCLLSSSRNFLSAPYMQRFLKSLNMKIDKCNLILTNMKPIKIYLVAENLDLAIAPVKGGFVVGLVVGIDLYV